MPDLLYPYLVGVVSTIIVLLAAIWAFIVSYRRAIDYARKEERLPLAARWEDLSHRVADLELERDQLRDELQQAKLIIEEAQREREWLDRNRSELEQMKLERQQLEHVRADLQQALEQLASARQRLDELQGQVTKADFTRQQLEERAKTLDERIKEQTASLKREETRLDQLRKDIADADSRLGNARGTLADLNEAIAQGQRRLESLTRDIEELTRQRNELKKQKESLEAETGSLRTSAAQLKEKNAALEASIEHQGSYLDDLRKQTRQIDKYQATEEEALSELWQPVIVTSEYGDTDVERDEGEALDGVRAYLEALGLRFTRRAVYSFHTSLKVAKDAPLLVLAGISGTGKSLLPRRYAEAMGIHFLNIPVQPRWDGPQDLIGFFNYLENRYKATELIRALIQMNGFNPKLVREHIRKHQIEERLLMVLLDEMNLARVEYYFSEFLSRLETRRDILDLDSDADRMKGELALDIGRFGREGDCRVFVDTNVLFVGTMNEDESTLTLSDKVIDRANVMRFGRPPSLNTTNNDGQDAAQQYRAEAFLHRDTWDGWVNASAKREIPSRERVEQWVRELNDALARIGRPFGYRTRNAILAYVQQYPDLQNPDLSGVRLAVADQIEQRILPKLRGVDVAEDAGQRAIDDVRRIVEQLGDGRLQNAIERGARSEGGHLFTWLGVERPEDE